MIQHHDIAFLKMKPVEVIESIFRLRYRQKSVVSVIRGEIFRRTHVHNIIEDNESGSFRLLLVAYPDLSNAPIAAKQVIQIFPSNLVV